MSRLVYTNRPLDAADLAALDREQQYQARQRLLIRLANQIKRAAMARQVDTLRKLGAELRALQQSEEAH